MSLYLVSRQSISLAEEPHLPGDPKQISIVAMRVCSVSIGTRNQVPHPLPPPLTPPISPSLPLPARIMLHHGPIHARVRGNLPRGGTHACRPRPQATRALMELGAAAPHRRLGHQMSVKLTTATSVAAFVTFTVALAASFRAASASSSAKAASPSGAVASKANPRVLTDPKAICGCRMSLRASGPRRVANSSRSTVCAPFRAPFPNTSRPTLISEGQMGHVLVLLKPLTILTDDRP